MSGGSLDYIQYRIDDAADRIERNSFRRSDGVLLCEFAKLLREVGEACHDIEWDFSSDQSLDEKAYARIRKLISPTFEPPTIAELTKVRHDLNEAIGVLQKFALREVNIE